MVFLTLSYVTILVCVVMSLLPPLFASQSNKTMKSVEGGFVSWSSWDTVFSYQFFSVLIIFIIFDLEVVYTIVLLGSSSTWIMLLISGFIVGTLILEWFCKKLLWAS